MENREVLKYAICIFIFLVGFWFLFVLIDHEASLNDFEQPLDLTQEIAAPDMKGKPVYSLFIQTTLGDVYAGQGFLCKDESLDQVFLVSAHHLLGESGGLPREVNWKEVPMVLKQITGLPVSNEFKEIVLNEPLVIEGASKMTNYSGKHDLLVLRAPKELAALAIPVGKNPPAYQEPVWLYASNWEDPNLFHLGTVVDLDGNWLVYKYQVPVELPGTSGAPVIDSEGYLVAVNLGGYEDDGLVGLGNPVSNVMAAIKRALK